MDLVQTKNIKCIYYLEMETRERLKSASEIN